MLLAASLIAVVAHSTQVSQPTVLVTGASGNTGRLLYAQLKARPDVAEVRAFVRDGVGAKAKAQKTLNCSRCDASEGIFYGDVTKPDTLEEPMKGVDTVAITVGVGFTTNESVIQAVEFTGVENQVAALAMHSSIPFHNKRVAFLSSMATTDPHPKPYEGGSVLFWKLNAEAFLGASGFGSTIIKPCGIEGRYGRGGKQIIIGHDDILQGKAAGSISREDVAAIMVEAIMQRTVGVRVDICIGSGPPTTDLAILLQNARYPWMKE